MAYLQTRSAGTLVLFVADWSKSSMFSDWRSKAGVMNGSEACEV